jgi:multidrug resistance protein MdtO
MSGSRALPLIDRGELQGGWHGLVREMAPRPGRFADTTRLVVLVLACVAIGETFRMPEIAVSAYVVLFVSRGERASTVKTALVAGIAVILAVFVTIVVFMASLAEPALRIPLIAAVTFVSIFASRISPLGPAAFAAGFIIAYGLTLGDQVLGLSLQAAEVGNTTEPGLPQILFIPPEEALLHFLLWLAPVIALPVALVIVANLLTGREPALLVRAALARRLGACAAFCAGERGAAQALAASAREGTAGLGTLLELAGAAQGRATYRPDIAGLIRESEQAALALLAWTRVGGLAALGDCTQAFRDAERSVRDSTPPSRASLAAPVATTAAARPLATEISRATTAMFRALDPVRDPQLGAKAIAPKRLISPEAARNPETTRFALKVTLAVMLAYAAESLLDWPAIHTCVVTCFFVSLGTIGESVHKATLRIVGALVGGALGIGTILLFMPAMTDLGDLLLALTAVTLLAGWVATGSERISYAGWQIGLAYYLTVLQGYGPTLDMQTARDRVLGIVLGNLIVLVVFTTVWPSSLNQAIRRHVETALRQLALLMRLDPGDQSEGARPRLQAAFGAATSAARTLMANDGYERGLSGWAGPRRPIDAGTIAELETIIVEVCVLLDAAADPDRAEAPPAQLQAAQSHHLALAEWFDRCATWVATGGDAAVLEAAIPVPPLLDGEATPHIAARAAWFAILDTDLRAIMRQVASRAEGPAGEARADG